MIVKNIGLLVIICEHIGPNRLLCDTLFHNIRYNNERGIYKQESFSSRFGIIVYQTYCIHNILAYDSIFLSYII